MFSINEKKMIKMKEIILTFNDSGTLVPDSFAAIFLLKASDLNLILLSTPCAYHI